MRDMDYSIYCAGPFFTEKEREEMSELATSFEKAGFNTFLPQRDGLELIASSKALVSLGVDPDLATHLVSKAIFSLDVYQVIIECDAIAVNLNGRVPDEGAVSEAALAWSTNKIVVGYKTDQRSVFMGHDNPLVSGLFDFKICQNMPDTVAMIKKGFSNKKIKNQMYKKQEQIIRSRLKLGKRIWDALRNPGSSNDVVEILYNELSGHKDLKKHNVSMAT